SVLFMNSSIFSNLTTEFPHFLDRIFSNTSLGHRLLERLDGTNLRHAFYLISPYETAVQRLEDVPNYGIEVSTWWFIFILLEFFILIISGKEDRLALNDSITSITAGMLSQCFKFGGRTVAIFLYVFIWNNFRILELPWDSPWTWILCLFFQDFMYYLGHRAVHEAGFFWGLHTIHHSSEYYNLSTALRQAAIQDAGLAIYDVLQAPFIPPPIFLVHRYFSEIFQFVMHTSLIDTCGPLGIIFNTPSHHRVHHGRNPYCIDKNYGGVFIIWDRMFNTFEAERKEDPPIYGLITNEETFNQLWLQFHTLIYILFFKAWEKDEKGEPKFRGFLEKLKASFYPPGWYPGVPTVSFFHWKSLVNPAHGVPEVSFPVIKYNPPLSIWLKAYVFGHFVLILAIFFHFEYDRNHLSYLDFTCKIGFFVVSMQTFGSFFDRRWYSPLLEILRCLGVLSYYSLLMFDPIGPRPHRIFSTTIFSVSALIMAAYSLQEYVSKRRVRPNNDEKNISISMGERPRLEKSDSVGGDGPFSRNL
ncbi:agmo-1, partial [Pristionchus pacificus]